MTLVIAHRGASRDERQNTLAAFVRARQLGADGVELDARLTADGQLVVHHDPHVDTRSADDGYEFGAVGGDQAIETGRAIIELDRAELPRYVPTLDEALDACAGMFVNIEIKNDPDEPDFDPHDKMVEAVAQVLHRRGATKRWLISSFRPETVAACRIALPEVRTAYLVQARSASELLDQVGVAADAGHDALHPWVGSLSFDVVHAAHAAGLVVNTWTCNDADRIAELIAWGVDGVCTDVPDRALEVRRRVMTAP